MLVYGGDALRQHLSISAFWEWKQDQQRQVRDDLTWWPVPWGGFECKMINGEPEDELRRLIIAFYPADGEMAAFEVCKLCRPAVWK